MDKMNKMYQQLDNTENSILQEPNQQEDESEQLQQDQNNINDQSQGYQIDTNPTNNLELDNENNIEVVQQQLNIEAPSVSYQDQQELEEQNNDNDNNNDNEEEAEADYGDQIVKKVKLNPEVEQQQLQEQQQEDQQDSQIQKLSYKDLGIQQNQQKHKIQQQQDQAQQNYGEEDDDGIIQFTRNENQDEEENNIGERKIAPWIRSKTLKIQNPVLRLHNEIIEFTEYLQPTEQEHGLRNKSYQLLVSLIKEVIPDCEVKSFGSFTTKLYLPNADIDMVIINEDVSSKTMYTKIAKMLMARNDLYESVNLITNAKVPIIKFVEIDSQINFDISFNKLDGVKQLQEVEKTLKIYPEMRYIIFVMKCMLRQRDLHETFKGGIGSFLLFCMILTFLRELRRQYLSEKRVEEINSISLGEYILKFFEFFAIKNDWNKKRIIMQEGGAIIEKYPQDSNFSLISPQDSDHDIGSSSFKIRDVFNVFKNRFHFMTNFNFKQGESVLKFLVNPSEGKFLFTKEEELQEDKQ